MRGSARKRKTQWNLEEESQFPTKISQSNTCHRSHGDSRENGRIGPNWSNLESEGVLKSNDLFHGNGDLHMDDGFNEETRGWDAVNSHAVGKSLSVERRQQIYKRSQKKSWEQLGRGRSRSWGSQSRSQSPVHDLKWDSYEETASRSDSGELSQPHRKFSAGRWMRGSPCRLLRRDYINYSCWEQSEIDLAGFCGSRHNHGGFLRGRSGSSNGSQKLSRDRSRSPSQSSVQNFKRESNGGRDIYASQSRELTKPCRNFVAGRCSRSHHCRFLHQDEHRYRDRRHSEIEPAESWGSGYEYGRFRYDDEEVYRDYPWDKDSHGYGSSCDEGRYKALENSSRSSDVCKDFLNGKCHRGSSCKYLHSSSGDKFDRSNRNQPFDYKFKHERILGDDTLCKYFAMGNCRNGDYCRFSHGSPADCSFEGQSKDYRWGQSSNDKNITAISDNAKSTGWGNRVKNMDFIDAVDVENSSYNRRGHRSPKGYGIEYNRSYKSELFGPDCKREAHRFGGTLCKYYSMGECRYGDHCSFSHDVSTHRKAKGKSIYDGRGHAMDDETKLWDGRTWDDIAAVSDAARSTGWGNKDAGNINCTNALNAKSFNYDGKPKCQSRDGKWAHASDGGKKLRNDPTWDDISSISYASKCTRQGNSDARKFKFTDEMAAENFTYHRPGHSLSDSSGREYLRSNRNAPSDHNHKPEAKKSGDTLCKYFANGKCRDGGRCRFSHGGSDHRRPICQSRDDKRAHVSDHGKILWTGPTWNNVSAVSQAAKITEWGYSDVKNTDVVAVDSTSNRLAHGFDNKNSSCGSLVLQDKALGSDERWSPELTIGSGDAITGAPESMVAENFSVREEPQSVPVPFQSQELNGTNDGSNLWNGPTWDDMTAVSDASKCTRQGISDVGKVKFTDEMAADRLNHSLSDSSGKEYLRSSGNATFDHNQKPEANESGDTLCKYFATGKYRDGSRCRFSHGGSDHGKPICQSRDGKWAYVSDDGKILWNGPTWNDVSAVSEAAKITGWGHSDVKNIEVLAIDSTSYRLVHGIDNENSSCGSLVLKDKALESDEHQSTELASGSGRAITGLPESMVVEKLFVSEKLQSVQVPSHSQKLNGTDDGKNLWNGPTWDDITAVSDASKCTRQGISDVGKMKFPDEMGAENSAYHKPGHSLSDTSGNEYLISNRNAPFDHNHKPESHENGDTSCKYFTTRKSCDEDHCRFYHSGLANMESKDQSWDGRWEIVSEDGKKLWSGPTWDDVSTVSQAAKFTGRSDGDVRNVAAKSTCNRLAHCLEKENKSCGSSALKDKAAERDEYTELASGSGGAIVGVSDTRVAAKTFVKEETQTIPACFESQKLNLTDIPSNWDVMQETSNLQLAAAVAHSTVSAGSNVEQNFIDRVDNEALANEVKLLDKIEHRVVVTRQSFKQEGDSLGSELVSSFDESSQDKQVLSSNPSISSLYTHLNGPVQQKVSPFNLYSQRQYQPEFSETAALSKSKIPQVTCGTPLDPASNPANTTESLLSDSIKDQNRLPERPKSIDIQRNSSSDQEYHNNLKLKGLKPMAKENSQTLPENFKEQQEGGHLENADGDGRVRGGNRVNDEKRIQIFRNALVEFVKEILIPTWKEGRISKDIYKTIVKKVVDKVCGAIQGDHIPQTRENIDNYLSSSKPNITKLVQAYLEIYPKS